MSEIRRFDQVLDDLMAEDRRKIARYDEAVRLLREAQDYILAGVDMDESQEACDIEVFLAAEPEEGK